MRLTPDFSRTLVGIGDSHLYGTTTAAVGNRRDYAVPRVQQLQQRVLARGTPGGVLHIGDITEWGLPEEAVNAEAWWADWDPIPKAICPGNHDIDNEAGNGVAGADTLLDWEARYGNRTQVIDAPDFRAITCLWTKQYWNGTTYVDQPGPDEALNSAAGYAHLLDLINDTTKPTVLAFHYTLREPTVPGPNAGNGYDGAITAGAETNVKNLIANCPNLQVILTGHVHSPPWYSSPWWLAPFAGTDGRPILHQNLGATTYNGNMGNVRSPLVAYFLTFEEDGIQLRILDIKNDSWIPRTNGFPRVEQYAYT